MKISNFFIQYHGLEKFFFFHIIGFTKHWNVLCIHNTYLCELFYGGDFTQYLTAIKFTIHHQSNLCYYDR